jgi:hypothetical protein
LKAEGTGIYQCFCAQESGGSYFDSDPLCTTWLSSKRVGFGLTSAVSYGIVLFNIIIREVNIVLIRKIGYHTVSAETSAVFLAIFIATFLNTGLLILLTGANTQSTILSWIPLKGTYTDLTQNWYLDIGPALISTMTLNSIYPYIDIGISFGMKLAFRLLDTCCCTRRTKKLTI